MTTPISQLPTPPQPSDSPVEFDQKAFALLGGLPQFVTEANTLGSEMTTLGAETETAAEQAAQSAQSASNSAGAAAGSATSANDSKNASGASATSASDSADKAEKLAPIESPTPPVNPTSGKQWINTTTGRKYTWFNDGNSSQWVEIEASVLVAVPDSGNEVSKHAILSYETKAQAEFAAATLPDGQVVEVLDVQGAYKVDSGALVFESDLPSVFDPGFSDTQKFPTILKLRDSWSVSDFLTGSRTDETTALQKALNHGSEERFSVNLGNKVWDIEDTISVSGPLSIIGNGSRISGMRFRNATAGLQQLVRSAGDGTTVQGVSFITDAPHAFGRFALRIDGRPMMIENSLGSREQVRGSISDVRCIGSSISSAGWGEAIDLISTGWIDIEKINVIMQARQGANDYLGRGILIRGEGIPVEINMRSLWMYNVGVAIQAPDYAEGISVNQYNFVNVSKGIVLGVQDPIYSLRTSGFGALAPVINGGHINASTSGITVSGVNQSEISSALIYLNSRGISTLSGPVHGLHLGVGESNNVNSLQIHSFDLTGVSGSALSLASIKKSTFSNISIVAASGKTPFTRGIDLSGSSEDNCFSNPTVNGAVVGLYNGVNSSRNFGETVRMFNCATPITDTQTLEQNKFRVVNQYTAPTRVINFAGGKELVFEIPLPADVFFSRPSNGIGVIQSTASGRAVQYKFDQSTASKAVFAVFNVDGSDLPQAGPIRVGATVYA